MVTSEYVDICIARALNGESDIDKRILAIRGFSTPHMRVLFHELTKEIDTYLEVGLYCGATFISAYNPNVRAIGVENYSQDFSVSTVKQELEFNLETFKGIAKSVVLYWQDCFKVDMGMLSKNIDMLYWDGEHSFENQRKAMSHYLDNLSDTALIIIDDTSWSTVRAGIDAGLEDIKDKVTIVKEWRLRGEMPNDDMRWHNGVDLYLIKKK